jgi:hypothetical protein
MYQRKMPCSSTLGTRDQQVAIRTQSRCSSFPERKGRQESGAGEVQRSAFVGGAPVLPERAGVYNVFQAQITQ